MSVKYFNNLRLCQCILQSKEIHESTLRISKNKFFLYAKLCQVTAGSSNMLNTNVEWTRYKSKGYIDK